MQAETAEEEVQELLGITFDTGCEQSTDLISNSADMIAWKKSEPTWEDIISDMGMPYYHVVEFGNRLPSTKCKAVAKMPQQARCYPFNNGRNCGGQLPADLPSLETMDPMEDIPNPKGGIPTQATGDSAIRSTK
jgi:hypothetical protein